MVSSNPKKILIFWSWYHVKGGLILYICMYVVVRGGISDGVGNDPFLCMKVAPVQHLFLAF